MLVYKTHSIGSCLLFLTLFVPLGIESGLAQQGSGSQSQQQSGQKKAPPKVPRIENEITITATRSEASLRTVGQNVTVISAQQIAEQGAVNVHEVLAKLAGFSVSQTGSDGGATSIFVRGGESDFSLVMIDGVRINQPGGAVDLADLGTSNIERIEVVRGPSSVLYGADAVSATINIITKQGAPARPSGSFSFLGGSYGTRFGRGSITGGSDRIQYSLGGLYSTSDGFIDLNNEYDRGEASARFSFTLSDQATLISTTRFSNAEYEFPTDFIGTIVDPNDFRTTTQQIHSLEYQHRVGTTYATRLQYGYHHRDFESFTVADGITDFFDSSFRAQESRHFLDWQNNFSLNRSNLFTTGVSFERESSRTDSLNRRSVGVYAQNQFSRGERFFLTGGIRLDDNDRFQNFVTGSLAAAFLVNPDWKLRASLGNGFRAPAFAEIIGFPDFGIVGNPNLDPEKNLAFDLGMDFFGGPVQFSGTLFFNWYSDLIEFSFVGASGSPNYQNVEAARSRGLELEATLPLGDLVRVGGHYTFLDTEVTDTGLAAGDNFMEGEELLRRPRHSALLFAQLVRKRYSLRADIRYQGERPDVQFLPDFSSSRIKLPAYLVTDLALTLPILPFENDRGDLAVVLRGRNIFNRDYTEIAGFQSPGRSFTAGLEIAFR